MVNHDYAYDVNRILTLAGQSSLDFIESFALQLDNHLHENEEIPASLVESTLEFVYEVLEELEERAYEYTDF